MIVLLFSLGLLATGLAFCFIDLPLAQWLYSYHLSQVCPWLWWLTVFGESKLYLGGLLLLALAARYVFRHKDWAWRLWFAWLCVLLPNLICIILKISLGRARPELWFSAHLYGFYGVQFNHLYWSFPSGHTTTIMGVALALRTLFPRYVFIWGLIACLVVISRVLLLQHYLSDVLIATWLCCLEIMFIKHLYRFKFNHG